MQVFFNRPFFFFFSDQYVKFQTTNVKFTTIYDLNTKFTTFLRLYDFARHPE